MDITILPGDGIGPEITQAVVKILAEATAKISCSIINLQEPGIIPQALWSSIATTKTLLKGPITTPQSKGFRSINVTLRNSLGLHTNIRPCTTYNPIVPSHNGVDFNIVTIRENEEDLYPGIEYQLSNNDYEAIKISSYSASRRISNQAFRYCVDHDYNKITCLIKDNILKKTDGVFHQAFKDEALLFPQINSNHYIVDIGMAKVATVPQEFQVIVTTNLYGDIVSDIIAQISGSVGLAGSSNIGDEYAMFEAVHGSAPDIAGRGIANPSGLLNAAIMLLSHLGLHQESELIANAWLTTLEMGFHTGDIYNQRTSTELVSTDGFALKVVENLGKKPTTLTPARSSKNTAHSQATTSFTPQSFSEFSFVELALFWPASTVAELIARVQSLSLVSVKSKGLEIWPSRPIAMTANNILYCKFAADSTSKLISLLQKLEQLQIEVIKMHKIYDAAS